jgi:predicted Zn-dependent protease
MIRLRQQEKAWTTLQNAAASASSPLPVLKEQVVREGIAAVTDSEWRKRTQETRVRNAREGLRAALIEMGGTVARQFTPEEKASFAQFAQAQRAAMRPADVEEFAVPLAKSAGLADLEARWRYEVLLDSTTQPGVLFGQMNEFAELQRRRLKFAELGPQLERLAPRLQQYQQASALLAAAGAYRSAGDAENELRVLSMVFYTNLGRDGQKRFLELLLQRQPQALVQLASVWSPWGQQVADFAVANGDPALVHAVVAARSRSRAAVWNKAYGALVGLYFAEPSPEVNNAFLGALGNSTIGERLGKPANRNDQLAGDIWFYYGSRYGEYLGATRQGNSEAFLPAVLEQSPASASGYLELADYYAGSGETRAAIADYNHTLELAPGRADVHDRLAMAYFAQGQRAEALSEWKLVFAALLQQVNTPRVPESFWADFGRACGHLRTRHLFAELKPDVDALLRAYLRRNGNYRSNAVLHSAYAAAGDPVATAWLLDLVSVAQDPIAILADVVEAPWIPLEQRAPFYQRILEAKQNRIGKTDGYEKEYALEELRSWQVRWANHLLRTKQFAAVAELIASLPPETRTAEAAALVPLDLLVAAQLNTLDARIAGYRADPQSAPASETLRSAARRLFAAGDKQAARKVLEFVFAREIDEHKLAAANFLGLAEIRVAAGDMPGALELLRRLVVAVGGPFENLDPAAALLEKTGHSAEAVEFLAQLVKATPWEASFRLRLAKARIVAGQDAGAAQDTLVKIASGADVSYALRIEAAAALAGARQQSEFGSGELKLLAGDAHGISSAAADQPFFYAARLRAAQNAGDARMQRQLLGNALADTPLRDDARIPLFEATVSLHADEYALAALEPLLRQRFLRTTAARVNREEEEILGPDEAESAQEGAPAPDYSAGKLPPAQQAQLAWMVGDAMARLDRLSEALPYLDLARKLEKAAVRRKEIAGRIAVVKSRLRLQQLNAARQPILHAELEQDRLVRPRLLAGTAPPARASAKGGERP